MLTDPQFGEDLALAHHPAVEVDLGGHLDGLQRLHRAELAAGFLSDLGLHFGKKRRAWRRGTGLGAKPGGLLRQMGAQIFQREVQQVARRDSVDRADFKGLLRRQRRAVGNHFSRGFHPDQTRHPLGAARPGDNPQGNFRQANAALGIDHPVVTAQGHFQAAAQGGAVNGRDHRLGGHFDMVDHFRQMRRLRRLPELANIGPGDEGAPLAPQHRPLDGRVFFHLGHRGGQTGPNGLGQGVHRRIIYHDQRHLAAALQLDDLVHLFRHHFQNP